MIISSIRTLVRLSLHGDRERFRILTALQALRVAVMVLIRTHVVGLHQIGLICFSLQTSVC